MYITMFEKISNILRKETRREDVLLGDGGDHADLASTIAFALAKERKKAPAQIATEIASAIGEQVQTETGATVDTTGPYINFHFDKKFCADVLKQAVKPGYGALPQKRREDRP